MISREFREALGDLVATVSKARFRIYREDVGVVKTTGDGIATVYGLPRAKAGELLDFKGGVKGLAFNLDRDAIGCILFGGYERVGAGQRVRSTGEVLRVPVGAGLVGRVVNPLGEPLDGGPRIYPDEYLPVEREAPAIIERYPVKEPLHTGIKSIDAMIPIGRGQRELIIGDRSTGKTAIALDAILNQRGGDVLCFYVSIGQKSSTTAKVVERLRRGDAMAYTTVVAADANESPGVKFIAPYAACSMAESFMRKGRHTLVIYDDLTKHAQVYREISLLMHRPPGREAYPGDIFYVHSRLLERASRLDEASGGGSLTALPIIQTEAGNIAAYIPTNVIGITDGQIYLDPDLFNTGFKPAIHIGKSVSRVGGKTQLPAMKELAGSLKLDYTQFQELESFVKFGAQVEEATRKAIERGQHIREILKQPQGKPVSVEYQCLIITAISSGKLDALPLDVMARFEGKLRTRASERIPEVLERIKGGEKLTEADRTLILELVDELVGEFSATEAATPVAAPARTTNTAAPVAAPPGATDTAPPTVEQ
jgi:F-type H+-transporting ATPase subunit alpha